MSFPGLHRAILEMMPRWALQTKNARAIVRKAGIRIPTAAEGGGGLPGDEFFEGAAFKATYTPFASEQIVNGDNQYAKLAFSSAEFDTHGWYDEALFRWKPLQAGIYRLGCRAWVNYGLSDDAVDDFSGHSLFILNGASLSEEGVDFTSGIALERFRTSYPDFPELAESFELYQYGGSGLFALGVPEPTAYFEVWLYAHGLDAAVQTESLYTWFEGEYVCPLPGELP